MKKGIFIIITLLAVLSQVFTPTFATVSDKGPISNLPIESVGTKTGTLVQPTGIKSWIVKQSMRSVAYALQNWGNVALKKALTLVTSEATATLIVNEKYYLGSIIYYAANSINMTTTNIRTELYNQFLRMLTNEGLFTPQIRQSIAWGLSQFLDLIAL